MSVGSRAKIHAALGDERRLLIVDHLGLGDRTVAELAEITDMPGNLLAHHLDVLDEAGLIERRVSEGDHRRRYVTLRWDRLPATRPELVVSPKQVAFICTHNSARSQFACAMWEAATGEQPISAGTNPSEHVHPTAVRVAADYGIDISDRHPAAYTSLPHYPEMIVSVCDLAKEAGVPSAANTLHWSVPDPVPIGTLSAFRTSFTEIARRVEHLAGAHS